MMCWQDHVRLAAMALARDKAKSCLTMTGVLIGSAAFVLVVAIASSGKSYIVSQVQGIGSNLVYAELQHNSSSVPDDELTLQDLNAAQNAIPMLTAVAGTYDVPAFFRSTSGIHHARLVAVTEQFQSIRNLRITTGRYFDPESFTTDSKSCVVSDDMWKLAFGRDSAVGNTLVLGEFRCTVIGTFEEGIPTFGRSEIQKDTLLIPLRLLRDVTPDKFLKVLYLQAATPGQVVETSRAVQEVLRSRHRPQAQYTVENLSSLLHTTKVVSAATAGMLLLLSLLTLTVAGVGIMNIMLVNVSERVLEIGLRKTVGASPKDIRAQFLLEAAFISVSGALLGVALAIVLILAAAYWLNQLVHPRVSWPSVLAALVLCSGVGVVFGYRPASYAANLSPADAMRVE